MKNLNDSMVNRTRDLTACGAMPQPTAPSRAPDVQAVNKKEATPGHCFCIENKKHQMTET
jgi:hypothetical protein